MYYSAYNNIRLVYMSNMAVSYKRQKLLSFREHLESPTVFGGVRVAHCFSFLFFFVCFACLRPVSLVCPNLPVSLDCQFLICPSVFSSVYLYDGLVHELFLLNYIIHSTMFEPRWLYICFLRLGIRT